MHILLPAGQIEDRVTDELSGVMAGNISAAIRIHNLHTLTRQNTGAHEQMFPAAAAPAPAPEDYEAPRMLGPTPEQVLLEKAGLTANDISLLIPHQANIRMNCQESLAVQLLTLNS